MSKKVKKTTTTTVVEEEVVVDNNNTEIIAILDRSGSMRSLMDDSIGGFNEFLSQQKKENGDALMTIVLFDDRYELLHKNIPLKDLNEISKKEWFPRGSTALNDAIARTINEVDGARAKLPKKEVPSKTLVLIITDGYENSSKEYSTLKVKNLIKEKEKDDWQFIYIGANQDAFAEGSSYGISGGNTFTFTTDSTDISRMYKTASIASSSYMNLDKNSTTYTLDVSNLMKDAEKKVEKDKEEN